MTLGFTTITLEFVIGHLGPFVLLAALAFFAIRAGRVWLDAYRLGLSTRCRFFWATVAAFIPHRYWWGARIRALAPEDREQLLAGECSRLGLDRADALCCPLCGAQVPHAWTLDSQDKPSVARGPVQCPRCDFRLDSCRHCTHFLPGPPRSWAGPVSIGEEIAYGRCGHYQSWQPVEQACSPDMARRMLALGHEQIRAPTPIVDSFVPPDYCRAFRPDRKRLLAGGIRWPNARHAALLQVLGAMAVIAPERVEEFPTKGEGWLL